MTLGAEPAEQANAWLIRLRDETLAPGEREAFERWLATDPAHEEAFARISRAVGGVMQVGDHVRPFMQARRKTRVQRAAAAAVAIAAAALLAIGVGNWALSPPSYTTAVGEQRTVPLADGSRVELNTDTRISVRYSESERRIALDRGEAVFDVVSDPSRPFLVEANGRVVRAVGTEFVVRVGADDLQVLVIEGVVSVAPQRASPGGTSPPPRLAAGDVFAEGDAEPIVARLSEEEIARNLAWRAGMLQFEGLPLEAAVEEVARYTNVRFEITDPTVGAMPVWAYFPASDLDGFLSGLEQNSPDLVVERRNREVRIGRRS